MELHTGDIVKVGHGRYKLINVLGQGEHSVVYDARGQAGEKVALKVSPDTMPQPVQGRRGIGTSSHLVRVIETERGSDGFLTVMERVDGIDLRELGEFLHNEHRRVAPRLAVDIIYQAARGLQDVYDRTGQVHGDLKPANLMLDRHGVVKILDYGINRLRTLSASGKLSPDMGYLAPEQADVDGQWLDDPRSDLFSLGAMLYEMIVGEPLYDFGPGDTLYQRLMTIARGDVAKQLVRVREVHPELERALHQALARDPDERFQSAQEMAGVLAGLAADLPPVIPLELFAESLYQALRTGQWSSALEGCLPSLGLDRPIVVGQVKRLPFRDVQEESARLSPATPATDEDLDIRLAPRPGMAMLAGMIAMLLLVVGLLAFFWHPGQIKQGIQSGAEAFSKPPIFGGPGNPGPPQPSP